MKQSTYIWSIIALTFLWLSAVPATGQEASGVNPKQVIQAYGQLPLSFEANQGQTDKQVRFLARGPGYSLFLTAREAVLALKKAQPRNGRSVSGSSALGGRLRKPADPFRFFNSEPALASPFWAGPAELGSEWSPDSTTDNGRPTDAMLRMKLVGANPKPTVSGLEELPGKSNYFIGNDPNKWRTNVPNYAKLKYENVYPGVDLIYYGNQRQLEYDFVVQPGADSKAIKLGFADDVKGARAAALRIDGNGDLVVGTEGGEVIFHKPVLYQPVVPSSALGVNYSLPVEGRYRLYSGNHIRFEIGPYDHTKPLVIDPTLAYSTYLGGNSEQDAGRIAVDASGNVYVTGSTGPDFPITAGAFQTINRGSGDVYVTKLDATGSGLVYSTFLGGSGIEGGSGIAVDASGNAYITGGTNSLNFPITAGAFQTSLRGHGNVFITKLNSSGSRLVYSTYLGGGNADSGFDVAVDTSGNAYVTGFTSSSNFPTTPGAFQTTFGGGGPDGDAFVSKLDAAGSTLVYSTFLGGGGDEIGEAIAVDASSNAYVTGGTNSLNFPTTTGAFQRTCSGGGHLCPSLT